MAKSGALPGQRMRQDIFLKPRNGTTESDSKEAEVLACCCVIECGPCPCLTFYRLCHGFFGFRSRTFRKGIFSTIFLDMLGKFS